MEAVEGTRGVWNLFTQANVFAWADRMTALERKEWEKVKNRLSFKKRGKRKGENQNYTKKIETKRLLLRENNRERRKKKREERKTREVK